MSAGNPRPRPAAAPVVVRVEPYNNFREILRLLPASLASVVLHGGLFLMVWLLSGGSSESTEKVAEDVNLEEGTDRVSFPKRDRRKKDEFTSTEVGPKLTEFSATIESFIKEREVKGPEDIEGPQFPKEAPGLPGGDLTPMPFKMEPPGGFKPGFGGSFATSPTGTIKLPFSPGTGGGKLGVPYPGSIFGRSGSFKDEGLKKGGGTTETEAAVTLGLRWIVRNQEQDGRWRLDSPRFKDAGIHNDVAGTAFGLLPLLGAGKTHRFSDVDDPQIKKDKEMMAWEKRYSTAVQKGLQFLIQQQDKKTGSFNGNMYAHGIATIAICEAYGLTQDPNLKIYAQKAINYIITSQHDAGGWRYGPKQAGDTSVVGWQVMALKSAQMSNLSVPEITMKKAVNFLESVCDKDKSEGYGYTGPSPTHTLTAVGLLCRQYLQSWGPKNPRMQKAIDGIIRPRAPTAADMYYTYYATQVMHHYSGQEWAEWNRKMRDSLLKAQDKSSGDLQGSFNGSNGHVSGRLMQTSLCLLTLEVYYRYLPLYYRVSESVASKD